MTDDKTKFVLYLEQILGAIVPQSRRSKGHLYRLRAELEKEKRFAGKALLYRVIDQASDYL
jgi:hypothetical protein